MAAIDVGRQPVVVGEEQVGRVHFRRLGRMGLTETTKTTFQVSYVTRKVIKRMAFLTPFGTNV